MRVGSLVELINDDWSNVSPGNLTLTPVLPVKNKVYTIRHIFDIDGCLGVYLEEIVSGINPFINVEQGFIMDRFRELMPPMSIALESILENELQEV
jgi:hypothetical protein